MNSNHEMADTITRFKSDQKSMGRLQRAIPPCFLQLSLPVSTRADVTECCKELLRQVWSDQRWDIIMKLTESMPWHIAAVITAKGEITKY